MNRHARLIAVACVVGLTGAQAAAGPLPDVEGSSGPVVLMGIDGEDGGPGGHGPVANYIQIVDSMLRGEDGILEGVARENADGLLVLGGGKSSSDSVTAMWNAVAAGADTQGGDGIQGEPVRYANGSDIADVDFAGAEILVIASSQYQTPSGGLTEEENREVQGRSDDIADLINSGGGLFGLSQVGFADNERWAYLGNFALISSEERDYSDIDPTDDGRQLGIDDNLDVCCWHEIYAEYPDFLTILAYRGGSEEVAVLGGSSVRIPREDCDNLQDDDGDLLIDQSDPDCHGSFDFDVNYLALGDSYSSGEGNPPFEFYTSEHHGDDSPLTNDCHRSQDSWPRIIGREYRIDWMVFRACSGAEQPDVLSETQYESELQPQAGWATSTWDLVTITIGGNDAGFARVLESCVLDDDSCTAQEDQIRRDILRQRPLLTDLYEVLTDRDHADNARLVVVGYPNIFPDPDVVPGVDSCDELDDPLSFNDELDADESRMLRRLGQVMENTLMLAANQAQVQFVSTLAAFDGHELCTDEPWALGVQASPSGHTVKQSFHPNAAGNQAMADILIDALGLRTVGDFPVLPIG